MYLNYTFLYASFHSLFCLVCKMNFSVTRANATTSPMSSSSMGKGNITCCEFLSNMVVIDRDGWLESTDTKGVFTAHVGQIALMCVLGLAVLFAVFRLSFDLITRTESMVTLFSGEGPSKDRGLQV
uniref:Uncharacterized protein n=1 Tax=Esox lucius TaxID=8010 RepID=A0A3P8ZCM7_ESOLU